MDRVLPVIIQTADGPMADPAGAEVLAGLLGVLESELVAQGLSVERWLRPGLGRDEVIRMLAASGLGAPEELITLYGWHNGVVQGSWPDANPLTLPNFHFASLDIAVMLYDHKRAWVASPLWVDLKDRGLIGDDGAGEGWLLIVESNKGCAVHCLRDPALPPLLHHADAELWLESDTLFRAVSLCTLVTWWIEGMRNGCYVWDRAEMLWKIDYKLLPVSQWDARFA